MKKLSHRDLIIVLGIAVAAIILVSSLYFNEGLVKNERNTVQPTGKVKPTVLIRKALEKLTPKAHL